MEVERPSSLLSQHTRIITIYKATGNEEGAVTQRVYKIVYFTTLTCT